MVFLVELMKLSPQQHFCPWEPLCVPLESILTPIVLAKVLQQPIVGPIGF